MRNCEDSWIREPDRLRRLKHVAMLRRYHRLAPAGKRDARSRVYHRLGQAY